MKKLILFSAPILCTLLLGFTAVGGSTDSNQCSHDCGLCPDGCGLTADVSIDVDGNDVSVTGSGSPGDGCTWDNMKIDVEFFNPTTEAWESKSGYNGVQTYYLLEYDGTGYTKVRARTICTDESGSETHVEESGWEERNIGTGGVGRADR